MLYKEKCQNGMVVTPLLPYFPSRNCREVNSIETLNQNKDSLKQKLVSLS